MKTVAIMQPYLFPYVGYFQLINAVDEYVVYDDVQYIVRGWINRNNIIINGQKQLFTISLDHLSANKLINEIEIKDDFIKLRKTFNLAYSKAPFVEPVMKVIDKIFEYENRNLAHFTYHSLQTIDEYIGINTTLTYSSSLPKDNQLKGQQKILDICNILGADRYINPIGGRDIYTIQDFKDNGIDLKFLNTKRLEYHQFNNQFIPDLSIIDVMMFNDTHTIGQMLKEYTLI